MLTDSLYLQTSFIQIKELRSNGLLQDVITKSDFGAKIRHARVFGEPRKPISQGLDEPIKREDDMSDIEMPDSMTRSISGFPRASRGRPSNIPPQILVLTLDSGDLLFLYATESQEHGIQFITYRKPLPNYRSQLEQVGKHIAVDPRQVTTFCSFSFQYSEPVIFPRANS